MKPFRVTASYFNRHYWTPDKVATIQASNYRIAIQKSGWMVKDSFTITRFVPGCEIRIKIEPLRPVKFSDEKPE